MPDTWEIIDNQKTLVMQPFYNQVDRTRKRLNLTPFELTDYNGKDKLDDVLNVTENRSASYMMRIIAGLMSAKWQTVVGGQVSVRESHKIEQFIEANLQQADEYLLNEYGMAGLDPWLSNHVCHTSLIGVQWEARIEDGEYKIHCLPCDMRWTPFVLNKWVAPITYRTKDALLREMEENEYQKIATDDKSGNYTYNLNHDLLKDTDNEVRDYCDCKFKELWIEKKLVFRQPNIYGSSRGPGNFVIIWPPSGFMFRDRGYMEHESPGLLYLNEHLYDQLSRQLSIDATLGFNALNPPYEYETEDPSGEVSRAIPKRGESLEVPKGELHRPVPSPDINRAELASRDQINRLIDDAGPMAPRNYTSPPSAIEVATEVELLDELQNPRIVALEMFKSQLARLIIEQAILVADKDIVAGRTGRQDTYNVSDLKDPKKYAINYRFMKQNKKLAIVNEARALALWGKAPMKYILRDVLAVEDPDGWQREMALEKSKALNPAIEIAENAVRYAEEAEDLEGDDKDLKNWESMMQVHEYVMLMRQRMNPPQPGEAQNLREVAKEKGNAGGLISLLGQGKGV
jgi:hypothetical protein